MYTTNITHLVGIKKVSPPKLNSPDDFSLVGIKKVSPPKLNSPDDLTLVSIKKVSPPKLNSPDDFSLFGIKKASPPKLNSPDDFSLVGIKKVSPPKLNSPDDFSLNQAQSKCGNERMSKKKFHSIHPNFRHCVKQTESLASPREADHCSLDCNLQNCTVT